MLSNIRSTTPGTCVDGKPAAQKREDQPDLKELGIGCGLLVAVNRLPRAILQHHLTLPGEDPERKDSGKH